jgi:RNA polymerase sigma-70 factor (ECF subfamily)
MYAAAKSEHGAIGGLLRRNGCRAGDPAKRMNFGAQREKESELIAAILAGDVKLYHQLIRPYERSAYIMSLSYMKNEKDAEDVAQEMFIRAFRDLRSFRGDSTFSSWLIGIVINEAKNRLRRQATIRIASLDEPQGEGMPVLPVPLRDWQEIPSEVVEREEVRDALQEAVEMLPDICQQVFLLRDVEELNAIDTAQILGIETSLVKITLHRARMRLQRLLTPKLKAIN